MLPLPYNHLDLSYEQLPVRPLSDLTDWSPRYPALKVVRTAIPTTGNLPIRLEFQTDSDHLAAFFSLNWPAVDSDEPADASIVALRGRPETYNLPAECAAARWYCSTARCVWIIGNEFYGNVKISVRGLCSELAASEVMFVHGCCLRIGAQGLILCGASGAGKTTLTAALRETARARPLVVNEDWGPLSLRTGLFQAVGEPHLHMKYPSARALAGPGIQISPNVFPSENFHGDQDDQKARLMISPSTVFRGDLAPNAPLDLFALIVREPQHPSFIRKIDGEDLSLFKTGRYAPSYERVEHFMNGSLFLTDDDRYEKQSRLHSDLLTKFNCILVNNNSDPKDIAADLMVHLMNSAGGRLEPANAS